SPHHVIPCPPQMGDDAPQPLTVQVFRQGEAVVNRLLQPLQSPACLADGGLFLRGGRRGGAPPPFSPAPARPPRCLSGEPLLLWSGMTVSPGWSASHFRSSSSLLRESSNPGLASKIFRK